jgi:hypothetical protein
MHLGDQLDAAGIAWRAYAESAGGPCVTADVTASHYATRHVPFLYYDDVRTNHARCVQRVRDFGDFGADLTAGTYRYSMITPNLCHDMHDACGGDNVANGNAWLMGQLPAFLARPGFAPGGRDVLFIVWDEQDNSIGSEPIALIVISPLARTHATTATTYNHYSLLATIEDGLGVGRIAHTVGATPIHDVWR